MSDSFDHLPDALIAVGLGANKGFWMIQPRDDEGQWIEMGAHVIFRFRTGKGNLVVATQHGVYVGPSGKPGFARVLIPKDTPEGLKAGVYDIESRNLQQFKAIIPGMDGKSSETRLDKFGKPVQTLDDAKLPALNDLLKTARAITPQDQRLAKGDLTPEERSAQDEARKSSPLADKPAGFENEKPAEAEKLLKDAGAEITPTEGPSEAPAVKPASVNKKSKSSSETSPAPGTADDRSPIEEIMAEVAYNGDTKKTVDDLIKEQQGLDLAREAEPTITPTLPLDLNVGDIITNSRGMHFEVESIRLGNAGNGIPADIMLKAPNGETIRIAHDMRKPLNVVPGRKATPSRPRAPRKNPEKVNAPDSTKTSAPETKKEATPNDGEIDLTDAQELPAPTPGLQPANFPPKDRMDDGSEFELPVLSNDELDAARAMRLDPLLDPDGTPAKYVDENNRVVDAEDPFSLLAALAKIFPNAKFTKDGALVLHRQKDKDGRIFELRANNSGKKAIVYSMRWTDPATGQYTEYQHKDDRHSITALFRKDNGPQDLLDRLLGRTDNKGKNWATLRFGNSSWGPEDSLFKRLRWFMSGTGDRKKMEDIASNAIRLAQGRQAVYHKDGTIKNSEIPSLWEALKAYRASGTNYRDRDPEVANDLYQTLYAVFGRIPLDEKSHSIAKKALRREYRRLNPNASQGETASFDVMITNTSERLRGIYREPDAKVRSIRYASKDRTRTIEQGMTVEYTNNVGETSTVKVVGLVENRNAVVRNLTSYDYGDYVVVKDANGRQTELNALKLKILRDQNSALTVYKPNLQEEALRQKRIEQGVWSPESGESTGTRDRAPRYSPIPGQDTVLSDPPPAPQLVDDFVTGEMLYDKEGRPLGIIKSVKPIVGRDGQQGLAFLFTKPDGTEGKVAYALGTEITPKKA
jgi:hypothetical protein